MKLTSLKQRFAFLVIPMAIAAALSATSAYGETIPVEKIATQQEGRDLIDRLQGIGRDMQKTAEQLQVHGASASLTKQTRSEHLNSLKERTNNDLGPAIVRLTEIRSELPAWQQSAVDSMLASAQSIAQRINQTILHQNNSYESHAMLDTKYKELVAGIVQHTGNLIQTADAAGSYASAYGKAVDAGLNVGAGLNVAED